MLNFEFQQAILKLLVSTYVDERKVDLLSKEFAILADEFVFNLIYLKREKLIDLSSLSNRAQEDGAHYAVARAVITHAGLKAYAELAKVKLVHAVTE